MKDLKELIYSAISLYLFLKLFTFLFVFSLEIFLFYAIIAYLVFFYISVKFKKTNPLNFIISPVFLIYLSFGTIIDISFMYLKKIIFKNYEKI